MHSIHAAMPEIEPTPKPKTGIELIAEERERQISAEGWTPTHDDEHDVGELALAAATYAINAACHANPNQEPFEPGNPPETWPWGTAWWKPKDALRDLTRAGALIAAEIDRLQRAEKASQRSSGR